MADSPAIPVRPPGGPEGAGIPGRVRSLERWADSHDAWSRQAHSEFARAIERIEAEAEAGARSRGAMRADVSGLLIEVGRLKVKMGFVLLIAASIGGIIGTVVSSVVLKVLGAG